MSFCSNAFRFSFVLALAACNDATSGTRLRGNSPTTIDEDTRIQSLTDAHTRMLLPSFLGNGALAVQAGAGITFGSPPTHIKGNVCGDGFFTGDLAADAYTSVGGYYLIDGNAYRGGCSASPYLSELHTASMDIEAKTISGAIGGPLPFEKGAYSAASFTIAANTNVILKGGPDDIFIFRSSSYMVTGANTHFILQRPDGKVTNGAGVVAEGQGTLSTEGPQAKNILFVLTSYATTGAGSTLQGAILAGAAITHGARSDVSGYVLATAAITVGEACLSKRG